jgi:hypothetical protein
MVWDPMAVADCLLHFHGFRDRECKYAPRRKGGGAAAHQLFVGGKQQFHICHTQVVGGRVNVRVPLPEVPARFCVQNLLDSQPLYLLQARQRDGGPCK